MGTGYSFIIYGLYPLLLLWMFEPFGDIAEHYTWAFVRFVTLCFLLKGIHNIGFDIKSALVGHIRDVRCVP